MKDSRKRLPLTVKQLIELDGCTRCEICKDECTVYRIAKQDPSVNFPQSYAALIRGFRQILRKQHGLGAKIFGSNLPRESLNSYIEGLFRCTTCGRCRTFCPIGIDTRSLGIAIREYFVQQNLYPKNFDLMKEGLKSNYNVFNLPYSERTFWGDYAPTQVNFLGQVEQTECEAVYFVGCMTSYSPTIQDIAVATATLLDKMSLKYICLGSEEWCCGYPLILAGMRRELDWLKEHNIERVKALNPKIITFSCPSCYHTWVHEYAPHLPGVKMLHSSQLLYEMIKEGRVKPKPLEMKVTYHDPCDLGRNSGVYNEPREVINSIPKLTFKDMPNSRDKSWCCGGGGDVEMVDENLPYKLAKTVLEEAEGTGAEALITACGQCKRIFLKAVPKHGKSLKVMDINELVLRSIE